MKMESNRRLFVMLRPLDPMSGHSGYARLELSNGRAQITVAVQGFTGGGGPAYALLLGGGKVAILGKLVLDIRGQGGLQLSVNLNDIDGLPFVSYGILAVGRELFDRFQISLAGTVGRGGWVDYAQAQRQVFEQLHPASRESAAQENVAAPAEEEAETQVPDAAQEDAQATVPDAARESAGGAAEGVRVPEEGAASSAAEEASGEEAAQAPAVAATAGEERAEGRAEGPAEDPYDLPALEAAPEALAETPLARIERVAGVLVEREASVPLPPALEKAFWPQSLWPLHDLFQRFSLDPGFDRQGELFARVPLEGEGWDHFLLGVRLDGNWVTGAGYCVPAAYGDPPQGFEEADFMAAKDGRGYYCLWEEV